MKKILAFLWSMLMITTAWAAAPLWTFEPLTATTIVIPANGTANVQYRVTNQSSRPHTLAMQPIPGATQVTAGLNICSNPFVLGGKESCVLSIEIDGSQLNQAITDGPLVCQQDSTTQCYRPSAADVLHLTQASPVPVISPSSGTASGGTGFTLTGTGLTGTTAVTFDEIAATSVNVVNPTMVTGVTPAHGAGVVDVVINTPAGNITLANGYTYDPTAIGQPSGGGTIACLNGGLNDLIAANTDISASIEWGGYNTAIGAGAQSDTDGAGNTMAIVGTLGSGAYAARLCYDFEVDSQGNTPCQVGNACYNDWFLPAGNNLTSSGQLNCLYTNQATIGGFNNNAAYWSSTESLFIPTQVAWLQYFADGFQIGDDKVINYRVRCVRAFTP